MHLASLLTKLQKPKTHSREIYLARICKFVFADFEITKRVI
jgi:hypothetical protein